MKTKIKTLIILIAVFSVSLIAGIFAGCIGEKNAKEKADELGMTACVTYYTNGGNFKSGSNTYDQKAYRTDYYKPGTPLYNIGFDKTSGQPLTIERAGYKFAGWEYAKLDENKLPILYEVDGDGNATGVTFTVLENGTASIIDSTGREMLEKGKRFWAESSGEAVFDGKRPTLKDGEHIYLVAKWNPDVALEYRLVTDSPITVTEDGEEVTYNNGDVIFTREFTIDTLTLYPDTVPKAFSGFSYINLYRDEACQEAVVTGDTVEKDDDETNPVNSVIYAKYLKGSWTAVKTANQAATMLRATGNGNYFVVYDIDCTGATFTYKSGSFGGVIEGNGKTLSNISISTTIQNGDKGSLLGSLTANAKVKNLTIENVDINITLSGEMSAYVLVADVEDGAVIENVSLDTVKLTVDLNIGKGAELKNIKLVNGEYEKDNWLYGAYETDAEFIAKYGDLITNATLIINEKN